MDTIIYYAGLGISVTGGLATLIFFFIAKNRETVIKAQLEKEYGEPPTPNKESKNV